MILTRMFQSIALFASTAFAFKTIQINRNLFRSIKLNAPSSIPSQSELYVFHGGLFGKIPTDAYSSLVKHIVDSGGVVVHGNEEPLNKDDIKTIGKKLRTKITNTVAIGHSTGFEVAKKTVADKYVGLDPIASVDIYGMAIKSMGVSENMLKLGDYLTPKFDFNYENLRKSFFKLPWEDEIQEMTVGESVDIQPDIIIMAENTYTTNNFPMPFHMGFAIENDDCVSFKANGVGHTDILNEEWMFPVRDKFEVPDEDKLETYRKWVADVITGQEANEKIDIDIDIDINN